MQLNIVYPCIAHLRRPVINHVVLHVNVKLVCKIRMQNAQVDGWRRNSSEMSAIPHLPHPFTHTRTHTTDTRTEEKKSIPTLLSHILNTT
jgi:hypothetical protein